MSEHNAVWHRWDNEVPYSSPQDVVGLAPPHTLSSPERGPMINPFLTERRHGWWDTIGRDALVDEALLYVELEDEATTVRTFKIDLVDGLMQIPEYTAAVIRMNQPRASDAAIHRQIDARVRRQARLRGASPIHVEAVITEGALRIQVGGRATMRRQLEHLLALMELPNIDLRVVPGTGAYPAMGTPFYILSFDERYPDIGYVELLDKGVYLEEPGDLRLYHTKFASLRTVALDQGTSRDLVATIGSDRP